VCDLVAAGIDIGVTTLSTIQTLEDFSTCNWSAGLLDGATALLGAGGLGYDLEGALRAGGEGSHVLKISQLGQYQNQLMWAGRVLDGSGAAVGGYQWARQAGQAP
jgi:hypothetical protein